MEIDVVWTAREIAPEDAQGSTVLVIDVLRATTMIAHLLSAKALEVRPVLEVEEAREAAQGLGNEAFLAGERNGLPPEGFDMGNSPSAVRPDVVLGKTIVITTTNGTLALNRSLGAERLAAASFVNAGAVVEWVFRNPPKRLLLACAGTKGRFSLDDALCAGLLVARIGGRMGAGGHPADSSIDPSDGPLILSDSALAAFALYEHHKENLLEAVRTCRHGRVLTDLGLGRDIDLACRVDSLDVVPERAGTQPPVRLVPAETS